MAGVGEVGEVREDRRVRRTRRVLREALLALVTEKSYDRVTVQDVLERADVGRATFYAHFRDKDDLLLSGFDQLRETLGSAMALYERDEPPGEGLETGRALFEHVAGHRALYRGLTGSRAGALLLRRARAELVALTRAHFERVVSARRGTPTVPLEILAEHIAGALLGVLTWWLDGGCPYPPQEMAATFERLAMPTIHAALGLPDQGAARSERPGGTLRFDPR